jgi:hypothetical protein
MHGCGIGQAADSGASQGLRRSASSSRSPRAGGPPGRANSASAAGLIVTIRPVGVGRHDARRGVAEQRLDVVAAPDEVRALIGRAPAPSD